ncbi:BnaCnng26530D [Brassica napus]|uniref:BnaCnng26530D protein n=1 Tax=Brassica napus TaxID=3708 RepID=A0A078IYQ9_BRANA|nr:BnaCnng26530D [Brassica napus]
MMNTNLVVANRVDADIEDAKVAWFECIATIGDVAHGSSWYLAKISVYDNDDQASFVLLGGVGHELSGKKASELVEKYFEANENVGDDHLVPVPQALIDSQIRCEGVRSQCDWQDPSFDCDKVADDDPSTCFGSVKRVADNVEAEYPKRARSG